MPLTKESEYLQFICWIATPEPLRNPKTQKELAEQFKVAESTFSDWKKREGFWDEVKKELKMWAKGKTPNVIMGLYRKAVKDGNAAEAKLWLEYIEEWEESQKVKQQGEIKVTFDGQTFHIFAASDTEASNIESKEIQSDSLRQEMGQNNISNQSVDSISDIEQESKRVLVHSPDI